MNQQHSKAQQKRKYRLNKKKFAAKFLGLAIAAVLVAVVAQFLVTKAVATGEMRSLNGRLIVLDAGHGGVDSGATGVSGSYEDDLNLAVARDLKAELEAAGARVIMTRNDENAIADTKEKDMAERRRIIEQSGSDIVVSIHMNWYKDPGMTGPIALFMQGSEEGERLAGSIQTSLNEALNASGTTRTQNLYILKSGNQPCVLVECGFISNWSEEQKLKQPAYQREVAKAIAAGVGAYFSGLET